VIAALAEHYHWPHDYWRRMGWREFRSWLRARNRSVKRQREGTRTSPDSWRGRENDPVWQQHEAAKRQFQGR
jgi:hypothetical protein